MSRKDTKVSLSRYDRCKARRFDILELIAKNSNVGRSTTFTEIREKFESPAISASTLSGDLSLVQSLNVIEKQHHGSYRLVQSLSRVLFANTHYGERQNRHKLEKELIAQKCLDHQVDGRPLLGNKFAFICHGTSTEPLFKAFKETTPDRRPQNVVTNSLPGMLELLDYDGVRLSIIGGRPDLNCGAMRPQPGIIGGSKLGMVEFNIVVLSCSSIDTEGYIWCGDDMEDFRKAIIEQAKEKRVDIVVLADRSKLGAVPVGVQVGAKIDLDKKNTWLFVDVPKESDRKEQIENSDIFKGFLSKLGDDRFVRVPVPSEEPKK